MWILTKKNNVSDDYTYLELIVASEDKSKLKELKYTFEYNEELYNSLLPELDFLQEKFEKDNGKLLEDGEHEDFEKWAEIERRFLLSKGLSSERFCTDSLYRPAIRNFYEIKEVKVI